MISTSQAVPNPNRANQLSLSSVAKWPTLSRSSIPSRMSCDIAWDADAASLRLKALERSAVMIDLWNAFEI